ncbi:MAG: hypothetical protein JXR76_31600 [Deltaproteobacteria bacterium]|nr:hypothetical protein [Deltaproteobacteria bacterium]
MRFPIVIMALILVVTWGCGDLPKKNFDTESSSASGADSGSGNDSDTGGTGSDSVTEVDSGTFIDTGSQTALGTETETDTNVGTDTGGETDSDTGSDTGSDSHSDTGSDSGSDTGLDTNDTGTDTDTDSGSGADSDSSSESGSDSESDSTSDSNPDSETTPANAAPILSVSGSTTVVEGHKLSVVISASDAEANNVTLSAVSIPAGGSFDVGSGAFTWIPDFGTVSALFQTTQITLKFAGEDDGAPPATGTLDVQVTIVNDADEDTIADSDDNCPTYSNLQQVDYDSDNIGVACDPLIQVDESLSHWQTGVGARYIAMDANMGTLAVNFYVFDEDQECSVLGNCTESTALVLESKEIVTELAGVYPGAGDDEESVMVDNNGVAWIDLNEEAWRIKDGSGISFYSPTPPNTNGRNYFRVLPDGSTGVIHDEYYWIDIEMGDASANAQYFYLWEDTIQTPLLEDGNYRYLLGKPNATYLLTRDSANVPAFHVISALGHSEVTLNGDSALMFVPSGYADLLLCTYVNSTNIATLHNYADGVETQSVPLFTQSSCSDIYFPLIYSESQSTAGAPDAKGYIWFSAQTGAATWNTYRWNPANGNLQLLLSVYTNKIDRVYVAGSEFYAGDFRQWRQFPAGDGRQNLSHHRLHHTG